MIRFHNTLSGREEEFLPLVPGEVGIYTCGPTVYNVPHIGNFRAYVFEDLLLRFLRFSGYKTIQVMNLTDVDDKTIRDARAAGLSLRDYTAPFIESFFAGLKTLRIHPADHYPRATEHIPDMVRIIKGLLDKGVAYRKEGSIYFDISKFPSYGRLSGIDVEALRTTSRIGARLETDEYEKESARDFALWKAPKEGEPFWETEIGPGRPGWHIECSTMSTQLLGETVDIHGGGGDLAFPHHECEIAQVEPVTGKPFVRFWMHAAMVYHEGEKMSKSLGNLIMIRDLLKRWSPDAIRLYLASHHYRQSWSYDAGDLARAEDKAGRLLAAAIAPSGPRPLPAAVSAAVDEAQTRLLAALDADLDAPAALAALDDYAACLLDVGPDHDRTAAQSLLRRLAAIFGLRLDTDQPEARVLAGWDAHLQRFR